MRYVESDLRHKNFLSLWSWGMICFNSLFALFTDGAVPGSSKRVQHHHHRQHGLPPAQQLWQTARGHGSSLLSVQHLQGVGGFLSHLSQEWLLGQTHSSVYKQERVQSSTAQHFYNAHTRQKRSGVIFTYLV